jgi:hypothetical protein
VFVCCGPDGPCTGGMASRSDARVKSVDDQRVDVSGGRQNKEHVPPF